MRPGKTTFKLKASYDDLSLPATRHTKSNSVAHQCTEIAQIDYSCLSTVRPLQPVVTRGTAGERRTKELEQLAAAGLPVVRTSKWEYRIGPVLIWPYSGRWANERTQARGRINSLSMRLLLARELPRFEASAPPRITAPRTCKSKIDIEASCAAALKAYIAEAEILCELLRQFKAGQARAEEEDRLVRQRERENAAYAQYCRARKRLLAAIPVCA